MKFLDSLFVYFSSDVWKYKNSDRKYILGSDRSFSICNDSCSQKSTAVSQACILFNNLAGKENCA